MKHSSVHVRFNNPHWIVAVERESIPRSHHPCVDDAIAGARALALQMRTELIVHDANGQVTDCVDFGVLPL